MKDTKQDSWVTNYLVRLGPLLIGLLGLLAQETLPTSLLIFAWISLIVLTGVTLFPLVGKLLSRFKKEYKFSRLKKTCFGELLRDVKEFRELTDQQNSNSLLQVFSLAAQWEKDKLWGQA